MSLENSRDSQTGDVRIPQLIGQILLSTAAVGILFAAA